MNPQDPSSFRSRTEILSTGRTYHFIDEKPEGYSKDTPTILALHGFPDRWYGWRYQIGPWVKRGWRVIAPDALGYGGSEKPKDITAYTTKNLSRDLAALLDFEGLSNVILVAHDWGAQTAWRFAQWHPERVRMIICLSIPFYPPPPSYIPLPVMAKRVPGLGYQLYLADEVSTREIENNSALFVDIIFRSGKQGAIWAREGQFQKLLRGEIDSGAGQDLLTPEEAKFYADSFSESMYGPLSYYKTSKLRYQEEKEAKLPSRLPLSLPALFIRGTEDPSSPPDHARRTKNFVPSLQVINIPDAGHWLMVERKNEITNIVADWIAATLKAELVAAKL